MLYLDLQGSFAHHLIHSTLSMRQKLVLTTYIQTQSRKPTLITSRTNVNAKSFIGLTLDSIFHFQRRKVFGMLSMVLMVSVGCFVQGYLYTWTLILDYVSGTKSRLGLIQKKKKNTFSGITNILFRLYPESSWHKEFPKSPN